MTEKTFDHQTEVECPECGYQYLKADAPYETDDMTELHCAGCNRTYGVATSIRVDPAYYEELVAQIMTDEAPIPLTILIKDAWLLVSALQLAVRHPTLHEVTKSALEQIARQFQQPITARHPHAEILFEMGWKPEYDTIDEEDDSDDYGPDEYDDYYNEDTRPAPYYDEPADDGDDL